MTKYIAQYADGKWVGPFGVGKDKIEEAYRYSSVASIGNWEAPVKGQENLARRGGHIQQIQMVKI